MLGSPGCRAAAPGRCRLLSRSARPALIRRPSPPSRPQWTTSRCRRAREQPRACTATRAAGALWRLPPTRLSWARRLQVRPGLLGAADKELPEGGCRVSGPARRGWCPGASAILAPLFSPSPQSPAGAAPFLPGPLKIPRTSVAHLLRNGELLLPLPSGAGLGCARPLRAGPEVQHTPSAECPTQHLPLILPAESNGTPRSSLDMPASGSVPTPRSSLGGAAEEPSSPRSPMHSPTTPGGRRRRRAAS